ncbi:purine-nucleoside phosphorylase [Pseudahrensia aquimaris]|uniref:Purine nucleoside phosphorylase n=1 Tax=Pseudahrensia aquimaris TaxID=744461 RepID=A0ABW3FKY2_9HYPH
MKKFHEVLGDFQPTIAIVLGSGLGGLVDAVDIISRTPYSEIVEFPESTVSSHSAELILGTIGPNKVAVLSGRIHYYEQGNAAAMRPALEALADCGVRRLILTNAAGSLEEDMPPGSIMQITDHINFSGTNPLIGEPTDARFVSMTTAYDPVMRNRFAVAADEIDVPLSDGVYMWFSGPTFETPAEIHMARVMGAHAVGMSTVPEVILARFFEMEVAAFSVITNFAAGMTGQELGHEETKTMAPKGGLLLTRLLAYVLQKDLDRDIL